MVRRAIWLCAGMALGATQGCAGADPALIEIMQLLKPVRSTPLSLQSKARGATPAFAEVKHRLRDWIESQLHEFHNQDEVRALAQELNARLLETKLACNWLSSPPEKGCPEREEPGYLGEIKLQLGDSLVVTTSVGIECGGDESAYAYSFVDGHWTRFWESETNNYAEGKYVPVNFIGIHLSTQDYLNRDADPNLRLMLALSRDPAYCESNWYNVYYRVWQLRIDRPEEKLLLEGGEEAFFGDWVDSVVSPKTMF